MRRAAKVDANQHGVVKILRLLGCSVQPLHTIGQGVPDLLLGIGGHNFLVEVKDGSKAPSARKLTLAEQEWHQEWRGQVTVIETEEQAVEFVNRVRGIM